MNLYVHSDSLCTNVNDPCPSQSCNDTLVIETLDSTVNLVQYKPCLDLCHRVLQTCPYYQPSSFQLRIEDNEFEELEFGGYPAFDCPG